jgi:hypothetical protein
MSLMCEYLALKSRFLQSFSLVLMLILDWRVRTGTFEQIPVLRKNWIHWSICPWRQN